MSACWNWGVSPSRSAPETKVLPVPAVGDICRALNSERGLGCPSPDTETASDPCWLSWCPAARDGEHPQNIPRSVLDDPAGMGHGSALRVNIADGVGVRGWVRSEGEAANIPHFPMAVRAPGTKGVGEQPRAALNIAQRARSGRDSPCAGGTSQSSSVPHPQGQGWQCCCEFSSQVWLCQAQKQLWVPVALGPSCACCCHPGEAQRAPGRCHTPGKGKVKPFRCLWSLLCRSRGLRFCCRCRADPDLSEF